jgi:hypothetical protein
MKRRRKITAVVGCPAPRLLERIHRSVTGSVALLEDLCGLIIQLGSVFGRGAPVLRHQLRAQRSVGVVEWVGLLPTFKRWTKLGKETPFK